MELNPPWPRISASLFYENPSAAIDWLCKAFGFEIRLKVEGDSGNVLHSELLFGDGLIMVGPARGPARKSPREAGGVNTQCLMLLVDDVEAHFARAKAAGAKLLSEPTTTDYGEEYWADRSFEAEDLEGHRWYIVQRVRNKK